MRVVAQCVEIVVLCCGGVDCVVFADAVVCEINDDDDVSVGGGGGGRAADELRFTFILELC